MAGSVAALSEIWSELQRAAGATERLVELLNAQDTVSDPSAKPRLCRNQSAARFKFEDVSFRYPARPDVAALDRLSLQVMPGETVAFVGPSGAGKTTVVQMIQRFYDPNCGQRYAGWAKFERP